MSAGGPGVCVGGCYSISLDINIPIAAKSVFMGSSDSSTLLVVLFTVCCCPVGVQQLISAPPGRLSFNSPVQNPLASRVEL